MVWWFLGFWKIVFVNLQQKLLKFMVKPLLKYDIFRFIDSYMDNKNCMFCFVLLPDQFRWNRKMFGTPYWRNPFWTRWTLVFFGWIPKVIPSAPGEMTTLRQRVFKNNCCFGCNKFDFHKSCRSFLGNHESSLRPSTKKQVVSQVPFFRCQTVSVSKSIQSTLILKKRPAVFPRLWLIQAILLALFWPVMSLKLW